MLVLTRKSHESVLVGNTPDGGCLLKVTVLEIRGDRVRLGLEAYVDVDVQRLEIWQQIRAAETAKSGETG